MSWSVRELEFNFLCSRYCDDIYRFARSILGNGADAEDATQEVLLRIWRNLPKVHLFQSRAWIMQMTRNFCLDLMRRRSSRSSFVLQSDEILNDHPDVSAAHPGQSADAEFLRGQITSALMKLPELHRSVFILYEINGLRYHEIARSLSLPINSVKVYLSRARQKLKQLLTDHESCLSLSID
jgi:RNA polymerase sigma-70 factor, ECF subfamily